MDDRMYGGNSLPPPLSLEDEKRLLAQRSIDLNAIQTLITHNLRLVVYIAKKFENTGIPVEDLTSIGNIGLMKAINTFSLDKKTKLATYASRCIENEILMYLRKWNKSLNNISLDDAINTDIDGNELNLIDIIPDCSSFSNFVQIYEDRQLLSYILSSALNSLSSKEISILFYTMAGVTQREIGELLCISQSYVSRLRKKVYSKMKYFSSYSKENNKDKIDITCSIAEDHWYIMFSHNFIYSRENFIQFLLEQKTLFPSIILQVKSNKNYISIKMPLGSDSFSYIAKMTQDLFVP